jgi:hypothetical protein
MIRASSPLLDRLAFMPRRIFILGALDIGIPDSGHRILRLSTISQLSPLRHMMKSTPTPSSGRAVRRKGSARGLARLLGMRPPWQMPRR